MAYSISGLIRISAIIIFGLYLGACSNGGGDNETPDTGDQELIQVDVSGSLSGLRGVLVLDVNGESVTLEEDGSLDLVISIKEGDDYAIAVTQQPDGQACSIEGGSGTFNLENGIGVGIVCESNTFTVAGDITLTGGPITLSLGEESLPIDESGPFQFSNPVVGLDGYNITISYNSAIQTCSLENNSADSIFDNVANVIVTCTAIIIEPQPISFDVTGSLEGLRGSLSLDVNGTISQLSEDGNFSFTLSLLEGEDYSILISGQPHGQVCELTGGTGTFSQGVDVNVNISCLSNTYTVGGNITLNGSPVVLHMGDETIEVSESGAFQFNTPVVGLDGYEVTVDFFVSDQRCVLENEYESFINSDISDVSVTCREVLYKAMNDGVHGYELWRTDGTDAGTEMVLDIYPGAESSLPFNITTHKGLVYFLATNNGTDLQVMVTDGTEEGTHILKSIALGGQIGLEFLGQGNQINLITLIGDNIIFLAPSDDESPWEMWVTDGTIEGSHIIETNLGFAGQNIIYPLDNKIAYLYDIGEQGNEWWVTDGSTNQKLADIEGVISDYAVVSDGYLIFPVENVESLEIWASDGTADGTKKIVDHVNFSEQGFAVAHHNGSFYYAEFTSEEDPDTETSLEYFTVRQVNPEISVDPTVVATIDQAELYPYEFFAFKDDLYVLDRNGLSKIDLSTGTSSLEVDLWDTRREDISGFGLFEVDNDQISLIRIDNRYSEGEFDADDLVELIQYDGENSHSVVSFNMSDALPLGGLDFLNDDIFLFARNDEAGVEPHVLTDEGLRLVKDVHPGTVGAETYYAITIGERVFALSEDRNGREMLAIYGGEEVVTLTTDQEGRDVYFSEPVEHNQRAYAIATIDLGNGEHVKKVASIDSDGNATYYDFVFTDFDLSGSTIKLYSVSGRLFATADDYDNYSRYRYNLYELNPDGAAFSATRLNDIGLLANLTLINGDTLASGAGYATEGGTQNGFYYYQVGEDQNSDQFDFSGYTEDARISTISELANGRVLFSVNGYSDGARGSVYEVLRNPRPEVPYGIEKVIDLNVHIRSFQLFGDEVYFVGDSSIWAEVNNEPFSILSSDGNNRCYGARLFNDSFYCSMSLGVGYELHSIQRSDNYLFNDPQLVKDINPGPASSNPFNLFGFKDYLYLSAEITWGLDELWRTGGSEENTEIFMDLPSSIYQSTPRILEINDDNFLFSESDLYYGRQLWTSDGTFEGTRMMGELFTQPADSFYGELYEEDN